MSWLYNYCGLSDSDLNNLNNGNLNNKRKRDFQKNNVSHFELDDDYESNWIKYVGIERENRKKLKIIFQKLKNKLQIIMNKMKIVI